MIIRAISKLSMNSCQLGFLTDGGYDPGFIPGGSWFEGSERNIAKRICLYAPLTLSSNLCAS